MKLTKNILLMLVFILGSTPSAEAFSFKKTMSAIGAKIKKFPKIICGLALATVAITAFAVSQIEAKPATPSPAPTPAPAPRPEPERVDPVDSPKQERSFCAKYWKEMLAAGTLAFLFINQMTGMVEGIIIKEFKPSEMPWIKDFFESIPSASWIATLGQSFTNGARPQNLIPGYLERLKSFSGTAQNVVGACAVLFLTNKLSGKLSELGASNNENPSVKYVRSTGTTIGLNALASAVTDKLKLPVNQALTKTYNTGLTTKMKVIDPIINAGIRFCHKRTLANAARLAAVPICYLVFDQYIAPAASSGISSAINYIFVNPLTTTIPNALHNNLNYWVALLPGGAFMLAGKLASFTGFIAGTATIIAIPAIGNNLAEAAISKFEQPKQQQPLMVE